MSIEDRIYLERRVREEKGFAAVTAGVAREVHLAFAEEYLRRLQGSDVAEKFELAA